MSFYDYWGKAKFNQSDLYHNLVFHSLDVASVAYCLIETKKEIISTLSRALNLKYCDARSFFSFIVSLHDLGKFSSAFQKVYRPKSSILPQRRSRKNYDSSNYRHDMLGTYFWRSISKSDTLGFDGKFTNQRAIYKNIKILLESSLGHHGEPVRWGNLSDLEDYIEEQNVTDAKEFAKKMFDLLCHDVNLEVLAEKNTSAKLRGISWQLAGLVVVSDWLGSDTDNFPYVRDKVPLNEYWLAAMEAAKKAVARSDFCSNLRVKPFVSIEKQFGFSPTPLQKWAEKAPIEKGANLFILEDITGSGKTEAALTLTHRILEIGDSSGFYFGLPTRATSNAMFERIINQYNKMIELDTGSASSIVLAHGSSKMNPLFAELIKEPSLEGGHEKIDNLITAQCNKFFSRSKKTALLAPVGVGTIDQAMLSVLPKKHQSLRLLGLSRKVLIFDEIHASDEFMLEIITSMLSYHMMQGGSAILLTATLPYRMRKKLCDAWKLGKEVTSRLQENSFPLVTQVLPTGEMAETPVAGSSHRRPPKIGVNFVHSRDSVEEVIINKTSMGECIVWVRNTVNDAIDAYESLLRRGIKSDDILLFHSRFALHDRLRIEQEVLSIFGKSSDNDIRSGKILISTQVFQESLDADADVMISDICLIDDLIQRIGRLHRHVRDKTGKYCRNIEKDSRPNPNVFIFAPEWSSKPKKNWMMKNFPGTQAVYPSIGRLWLTMKALRKRPFIDSYSNSRELIDSVYSDQALDEIPKNLEDFELEREGIARSKAAKARYQLVDWKNSGYKLPLSQSSGWSEDMDISTRDSEIEYIDLLLVRKVGDQYDLYYDSESYPVELNTLKITKTHADRLKSSVPEKELQDLLRKYPTTKFFICWDPSREKTYGYDGTKGFNRHSE